MTYAAWALFAVAALANWTVVARGDRRAEAVFKPLALATLIGLAVTLGATDTEAGGWLLCALAFGLLGDVMLLADGLGRFRAGLAAFLVGHLAYVVAFWHHGLDWSGWWPWAAAGLLVLAVVATRDVVPATWREGGPTLAGPVALYTLVIGSMLVTGFATQEPLVALGAAIFVASDSILSVDRFVRPLPRGHLMVMVTYHLGQALIVAGLLGWS